MEVSSSLSFSLSLSAFTFSTRSPRPPSLPTASSYSSFLSNSRTISLFNTTRLRTNSLVLDRPRTGTEKAKKGFSCYALFGLGVPELVVIAGVAVLVFGPKKLPEVGKSIGKTVKGFQQAAKELEAELKKDPDSVSDELSEKPTAVSEELKEIKVSSSKESV